MIRRMRRAKHQELVGCSEAFVDFFFLILLVIYLYYLLLGASFVVAHHRFTATHHLDSSPILDGVIVVGPLLSCHLLSRFVRTVRGFKGLKGGHWAESGTAVTGIFVLLVCAALAVGWIVKRL